ncbi:MAG: hypothetical protein R3182_11695, partial [Draconibacterium sp.]|nr:hypothetical protein [Draconibacterium sp.]
RPEHNHPNTGNYTDGFGNPSYIYAVGNPADNVSGTDRYIKADQSASGYGLGSFDTKKREITANSYRFLADLSLESHVNQFPGWPKTIQQIENLGQTASTFLPTIEITGTENPVVKIYDEESDNLVLSLRIKGKTFSPKVYKKGNYKIVVGNSETNNWEIFSNVETVDNPDDKKISIQLN